MITARKLIMLLAIPLVIAGCSGTGYKAPHKPPCFKKGMVYHSKLEFSEDIHISKMCPRGEYAIVSPPKKTTDVFGVKKLKPLRYTCEEIPKGTTPICL